MRSDVKYSGTIVNYVVHFYNMSIKRFPLEESSVSRRAKVSMLERKHLNVVRKHLVFAAVLVTTPEMRSVPENGRRKKKKNRTRHGTRASADELWGAEVDATESISEDDVEGPHITPCKSLRNCLARKQRRREKRIRLYTRSVMYHLSTTPYPH